MAASREEAKRQRELETERRRKAERKRKRRRNGRINRQGSPGGWGIFRLRSAVVMVLAAIAGVYAWRQQRLAEAQTQAAEQQRQLAETQRALAEEQRGLAQAAEKLRTDELFESQMTHAALLADGEEYARAREVLEESRELDGQIALERRHARDFLARYVDTMGGGAQQVYEGAGAPLFSVAVSPDGELLAAVGENGTVVLFDVASGAIRQRLEGHSGDVWDVAFHPEGALAGDGGRRREDHPLVAAHGRCAGQAAPGVGSSRSGLVRGRQPGRPAAGDRRDGQ